MFKPKNKSRANVSSATFRHNSKHVTKTQTNFSLSHKIIERDIKGVSKACKGDYKYDLLTLVSHESIITAELF